MKKTMHWLPIVFLVAASLACNATFGGAGSVPTPTAAPAFGQTATPGPGPAGNATGKSPALGQDVLAGIYARVSPGVVSLQFTIDQGYGAASGFVYDTGGHIITNYHVVNGATDIEVDFPSGFKAYGNVVGSDPDSGPGGASGGWPGVELHAAPIG